MQFATRFRAASVEAANRHAITLSKLCLAAGRTDLLVPTAEAMPELEEVQALLKATAATSPAPPPARTWSDLSDSVRHHFEAIEPIRRQLAAYAHKFWAGRRANQQAAG